MFICKKIQLFLINKRFKLKLQNKHFIYFQLFCSFEYQNKHEKMQSILFRSRVFFFNQKNLTNSFEMYRNHFRNKPKR